MYYFEVEQNVRLAINLGRRSEDDLQNIREKANEKISLAETVLSAEGRLAFSTEERFYKMKKAAELASSAVDYTFVSRYRNPITALRESVTGVWSRLRGSLWQTS